MKIHEPAMTFINPAAEAKWKEGIDNNQDSYGNACYRYASEWATLVEKAVAKGEAITPELFEKTSHDADTEGITGFMYGVAVSILRHVWVHGEALGKWHNRQYMKDEQAADEANTSGRTVNPALLSISPSSAR